MYSSTTAPADANNFYGFDLVVSKSVDTYIKVLIDLHPNHFH